MVNDFLPNVRGLVSHELHDKGESQRRIAMLLGITQARVSYYLRRRKSSFVSELTTKFGITQNDVVNYSKLLAEDASRSQTDGIFTLYSIWKNLLFTGMICAVHKKDSNVSHECSVCMEVFKPARDSSEVSTQQSEDFQILKEISRTITMIESSVYFPDIMPEVSVNVAMARRNPKTTRDVAAIPGRINRIHGRAKALVSPEFGSSNHMSNVLLLVNSRQSEFRSVINIKYDDVVGRILDDLHLAKRFTNAYKNNGSDSSKVGMSDDDAVLLRLSQTSLECKEGLSLVAIVDRGSEGVEPMTYLIGKRAMEVGQVALKIAEAYSLRNS